MSGHNGKEDLGGVHAPRHGDIARELRAAIVGGFLPVGSLLPRELDLCARYGVSRHTVRLAIASLAEDGLVAARKRLGTVVTAIEPVRSYRQTVASVEDLMQYGADHVRSVRHADLVAVDGTLAAELGCPAGTQWFCISSLRYDQAAGDGPLGLTDVYVDPAHREADEWARQHPDRLISSFVADRTGQPIARIGQDVTATLIGPRLSSLLAVEEGSPALRIVRRYLDNRGQLCLGSVSIHPASRFRVTSSLERVGSG